MSVAAQQETLSFQTEVQQLLNLMIHSLYSNKEIFLRELISNASDAADKLRFEAMRNEALFEGDGELKIWVDFDIEARTITVRDNGIGMTRDEVINNLGTIARSGTKEFFSQLTGDQAKDSQLIGQFGVGFYSAFVVADRVTVLSRKAGTDSTEGVRWESDGLGTYTVETVERPARGTEVILHLREDEDEFLDGFRLRHIVRTYSDHISLPIVMAKEGDGEEGEETVNRASALWMRPKQDISEDEYHEFYKHVAHDFEDPLAYIHNRVEGNQSYTSLLFIPKRPPFDLFERDRKRGIKLYVRRVFIMDDTEHLMPAYLRFVRGVVDSDDLPLNVSREILQHNRILDRIRSASVKRVLDLLERLAKDEPERYAEFWQAFGAVLKEGLAEDPANQERIAKLLRFSSTHEAKSVADVSLDAYIERMGEKQDKIYYLVADSFQAALNSPHLEVFRKHGVEVLLLTEPVDEWALANLDRYRDKPLQSVAKGDLDLGELGEEAPDEEAREQTGAAFEDLVKRFKETLGERVRDVRISHRLTDSPSCLVVEEHELGINMQRLLKAAGHSTPELQPILEINPDHALLRRLRDGGPSERFDDWARILFDQALLAEGGQLEDPAGYVRRVNELLMNPDV